MVVRASASPSRSAGCLTNAIEWPDPMPMGESLGSSKVSALILGAGAGQRMGGQPKAFLRLVGTTLLEIAVNLVRPFSSEVIVGLAPGDLSHGRDILADDDIVVVEGGDTRQATLSRLLESARHELILVHEVARPFARAADVERVLEAARQYGAAVLHTPFRLRDGVAAARDGFIWKTYEGVELVALQVPNAYSRGILRRSLRAADILSGPPASGTAPLVLRAGFDVRLVAGSEDNLKITYPEDWELAKRRAANLRVGLNGECAR